MFALEPFGCDCVPSVASHRCKDGTHRGEPTWKPNKGRYVLLTRPPAKFHGRHLSQFVAVKISLAAWRGHLKSKTTVKVMLQVCVCVYIYILYIYMLHMHLCVFLGGGCCETAFLASCLHCTGKFFGLMSELLLPQL